MTACNYLPQLLGRGPAAPARVGRSGSCSRNGTRLGTVASQTFGPYLPRRLWSAINRLRGKATNISDYSAISPSTRQGVRRRGARGRRGGSISRYRPRADPLETRLWVLRRVDVGNYQKGHAWRLGNRRPGSDRGQEARRAFCLSRSGRAIPVGGRAARFGPELLFRSPASICASTSAARAIRARTGMKVSALPEPSFATRSSVWPTSRRRPRLSTRDEWRS